MNNKKVSFLSKPVVITGFCYLFSFLVIFISYQLGKPHYNHGPGLHHIVGSLAFIGAVIWTVFTAVKFLQKSKDYLFALLMNLIIVGSAIAIITYDIITTPSIDVENDPKNIITINKSPDGNGGWVVDGSADTLLLIRNDSVLIDKPPISITH